MAAACLDYGSKSAPLLFFLATCRCGEALMRGSPDPIEQPANLEKVQRDHSGPKQLKELKPSQQCRIALDMRAPAGHLQPSAKLQPFGKATCMHAPAGKLQPAHAAGSLELLEGPGCHLLPLEQGFQKCKDGHHEAHRQAVLVQPPLIHRA